jgi:diadenylate cyclase
MWLELVSKWQHWVEVLLLSVFFYYVFKFMQGTRGAGILRGLAVLSVIVFVAIYSVAKAFSFPVLPGLLERLLTLSVLVFLVIFQPELRRALVEVGRARFFDAFAKTEYAVANEIVASVEQLSRKRMGALIAVERDVGLRAYGEAGVSMDAEVSRSLLNTIFHAGSDLHDGGVIIQKTRIAAASCYFRLSENPSLDKTAGSRHRAGLGLSEDSDALVIIVSEETGEISIAMGGVLYKDVEHDLLVEYMEKYYVRPEQAKGASHPADSKKEAGAVHES